jgi:hypothetical protein
MTDPLSAILAAIPGLAQAGANIASASDEAKRNAQLIEFQRVIIQLQSSIAAIQVQNSSLLQEKNELEKKIVGIENWEGEKQRYSLVTIWSGSVAYALKESMSNGEAPHWLCPNCFEKKKKSVLHPFEGANRFFGVACSACPTKIQGPWRNAASPEYAHG